jgi:peptidoglycan/LPS O-acetylase OafA/YrhL
MRSAATRFLKGVLVLLGLGAFAFLLVEPHFEGRNAHATLFEIYFEDPFLAYAFLASVPFFVGIFNGLRVLGFAGRGQELSPLALSSVRTIKRCAMALVAFVAGVELYFFSNDSDDRAGGVMIGVALGFAAIVVATAMAALERSLQRAVDLKSEHDPTV